MDLRERGGAHRLGGEGGEDGVQRSPEIRLDLPHDVGEALGRHLVLEAGELAGDLGRQDVDPRREELAELDQHAPHLAGESAIAPREPLIAGEGRAPEPPQPGDVEHDVPPEDLEEDAGHEAAQLAVAPEIDARGHGATIYRIPQKTRRGSRRLLTLAVP